VESLREVDQKTERGRDNFKISIGWECRITLKLILMKQNGEGVKNLIYLVQGQEKVGQLRHHNAGLSVLVQEEAC